MSSWEILLFFTKAGAFVFGSGLAIVPFLYEGVVHHYGWLSEQQFLDAVAVAMITPGPVVITVAFIGFLVAGFRGDAGRHRHLRAGLVLTVIPAPWFVRHRHNPQLRAFSDGATAAASGAIAGAVVMLGRRAIVERAHGRDRPGESRIALALQAPRTTARSSRREQIGIVLSTLVQ